LTYKRDNLAWRRDKILVLKTKGYTEMQIADIIQLKRGVVHRDLEYTRQKAKDIIRTYMNQLLPNEFMKCLRGIDNVLQKAWSIIDDDNEDSRNKLSALSSCNDCYNLQI
jgi:hypothetical protein